MPGYILTTNISTNNLATIEFGNPVLRKVARKLEPKEISTPKIQQLVNDMKYKLMSENHGVGLAAPQVGQDIALSVIAIRPTKHRPNVKEFDLVIINPVITKTFGNRKQMWEGCLSAGNSGLFAKVPRYEKIEAEFWDENGRRYRRTFSGLQAHIIQHETDHLNGVLFMDRVKDSSTYMTLKEYKKRVVSGHKKS